MEQILRPLEKYLKLRSGVIPGRTRKKVEKNKQDGRYQTWRNRRGSLASGRIVALTYSSLSSSSEFPPLDGFPLTATSSVSNISVAPPVSKFRSFKRRKRF